MKKIIIYDNAAVREYKKFSREVQKNFQAHIEILEAEGKLEFPEGKRVTKDLSEIRVARKGVYRGFYAYVKRDFVVILHFFRKKTQKTPLKNIRTAGKRLKKYA